MRRLTVLLTASFLSLMLFSCATNSVITDAFATAAKDAMEQGETKDAAFYSAMSSLSKAAEDITPENEYYIGRSVAAMLLQSYKVYENAEQEAYVNKIAQVIIAKSPKPELFNGYHVKILDSDEINAFATSGGHIFVTRGILNCAKSEDALAAVLAHEISHIQLKHSSYAIKASRYTSFVSKATGAAITYVEEYTMYEMMDDCVGDVLNELVTNGYSQEQEFQADEYAMNLMVSAGYNPREMVTLLSSMKQVCEEDAIDSEKMLKTHPEPKLRIKRANKVLKKIRNKPESSAARQARFNRIMHS